LTVRNFLWETNGDQPAGNAMVRATAYQNIIVSDGFLLLRQQSGQFYALTCWRHDGCLRLEA
jgi:hypothetical protein